MNQESLLLENIKEFIDEANSALKNKHFNSAVTLFFKALAVLCDLYILREEGFIPSNHTERFQILREKHLVIYSILDKNFPIYQNSYRLKLDESYALVLKNDIRKLTKLCQINEPI